MSGRVQFEIEGLEALKAELRALPQDLTGEASHIIEGKGNAAVLEIRRRYPVVSGKLRDRVTVEFSREAVSAGAKVESRAPHAYMFEYGTEARHTALGLNRGRMPPSHVFGQEMGQIRREMYGDLRDLLERYGLRVTGAP